MKFNTDHYLCGSTCRCAWALREYPVSTEEQAILRHLGEKAGVTLHVYTRQVSAAEEGRILQNASNILTDFDQRDEDKTSANILILGNSGQGKSHLMKLLMLNLLETGKNVISLDAEHEQEELCEAVGGCFLDLMAGKYRINPLEPKCWDDGEDEPDTPDAFRQNTRLAQHISFLKDFFRCYKDFTDGQIDTIEIMLSKLYASRNITRRTDLRKLRSEDYPTMSELYDLIQQQ